MTHPLLARARAAVIDLDGTLVDTLGDFHVALNAMLADLRLPGIEAAAVQRLVGKGSEHLIRSVLAEVGGDAGLYEDGWQSYQRHYLAINGRHARLYDGVAEGLRCLQAQGIAMACLTNKPGNFARPLLQGMGIAAHFRHVFGGDAFEKKKPDPLPVLRSCEALGVAPAQVLVIGDSRNDAEAARAAGCPVVLVTYGYNHGEPVRDVPADGYVDALTALCSGWPAGGRAAGP